ncbi:GNAT family N-acetyltransferase [Alteromonadaceae bacterium BrNp21-10]|nr:GNAT family N-acetyltransferase [Alteromonadaceae bacterium BrNp21-10]
MPLQISFINNISDIAAQWPTLVGHTSPFTRLEFLQALEQQGCVGGDSGWTPKHIVIRDQDQLIGFIPGYQKSHSYGEYIFDWAWAEAYQRHGLDYYPKWIAAIPFTPVPSNKLLTTKALSPSLQRELIEAIITFINEQRYPSVHWLYTAEDFNNELVDFGYCKRRSVQFHWFNRDYQSFEHFLEHCTSRKRKNIKRERQKVADAGVEVKSLVAKQINPQDLLVFYQCYQQTYLKRSGHGGYLTFEFFQQLLADMPENLLLVLAYQQDTAIAAALFLHDENSLYGRYWGALTEVDGLHFECCLYQGIDFCIRNKLTTFNPGTQGEHKISRGFEPVWCYSSHQLRDDIFHQAVQRFVVEETQQLEQYKLRAQELLPFKS